MQGRRVEEEEKKEIKIGAWVGIFIPTQAPKTLTLKNPKPLDLFHFVRYKTVQNSTTKGRAGMNAEKRKKTKRIKPKSVTVYFVGENEKVLQDIEELAKDLNMPMSALCVNLLRINHPVMRHYADALKDPDNRLMHVGKIAVINGDGAIINLDTQQEAGN